MRYAAWDAQAGRVIGGTGRGLARAELSGSRMVAMEAKARRTVASQL